MSAIVDFSRQRQTVFGDKKGNCFATCVACLIGLHVAEVPNFCLEPTWLSDAINWLYERGWGVAYIYNSSHDPLESVAIYSSLPYIQTGKSPRGDFLHCALYQHGKLVHDPHPSGLGTEGVPRDYIVLFPLSPLSTLGRAA